MNYEEYVNHMSKKYQLAVALAVIKNKPDHLTTDQYIEQIKENINFEKNDDFVCSDDFIMDNNASDEDIEAIRTNVEKTTDFESINTYCEDSTMHVVEDLSESQNEDVCTSNSTNLLQFYDDIGLPENMVEADEGLEILDITRADSLNGVLKSLRDIDQNTMEIDENLFSQSTNVESSASVIPDTYRGLVDLNTKEEPLRNINFKTTDKDECLNSIDERLKAKVAKNIAKPFPIPAGINEEGIKELSEDNNSAFKFDKAKFTNICTDKYYINEDIVNDTKAKVINNVRLEIDKRKHENKTVEFIDETENILHSQQDSQATIAYTLHGFTENTQISQSQYQHIQISNKFIVGSKQNDEITIQEEFINDAHVTNINNNEENCIPNSNIIQQIPQIVTVDSQQIKYIIDQSGNTYAVLSTAHLDKNNCNRLSDINAEISNIDETCAENNNSQLNNHINKVGHSDSEAINTETSAADDDISDDEVGKNDSQESVVPFKVIKELSKIKAILNKKNRRGSADGFSSDSGYRSDSQSSFKSALSSQQCESWTHESAYSLYSYLIHCPLVAVNQEIVKEISQVLGRLIDKLHEEEIYPNFLDELLDKVANLLRELSERNDACESILLEKDEIIQRLLLLNKSAHIMKFTLDKITAILDKIHADVTSNENAFEITNIQQIENLSYLFYVLEILIEKYIKVKDNVNLTQSQNSQENKILKKSNISEIWRRKWNAKYSETKNVGSQEKQCVLVKCGNVLNKIIVDCIESYSLLSFAALQCFNLLQNQ